jgi:Zn-dependent protease with chaperone function
VTIAAILLVYAVGVGTAGARMLPQASWPGVAGRHPTVIVTTGAVRALARGQLEAVLAHERAHLAWCHHRLMAMARISRRALPFLP